MKNEIEKKLLCLMYMEIVIEREGGLVLEGDLERLEKLYGMEVKNKMGKIRCGLMWILLTIFRTPNFTPSAISYTSMMVCLFNVP